MFFATIHLLYILFLFSSGWISKRNIHNYSEFKNQFSNKNKTASFQIAIKEIEEEISRGTSEEITLKLLSTDQILSTFDEHFQLLKNVFKSRAKVLDRFNVGNGLDYLTILHRTLTQEQQHQMYIRIIRTFPKDEKSYMQNQVVNTSEIFHNPK